MRGLGSGNVTCGPMRGLEKNCMGRGQTDKQTNGHRDCMTESAQWANSVKIIKLVTHKQGYGKCYFLKVSFF